MPLTQHLRLVAQAHVIEASHIPLGSLDTYMEKHSHGSREISSITIPNAPEFQVNSTHI